jgi:hypothetical protein
MQVVEQNSEFIVNTLIPQDPTGMNETKRQKLKSMIVEDLMPAIDWEKYKEYRAQAIVDDVADDIKKNAEQMGPDGMPMDPNMGY